MAAEPTKQAIDLNKIQSFLLSQPGQPGENIQPADLTIIQPGEAQQNVNGIGQAPQQPAAQAPAQPNAQLSESQPGLPAASPIDAKISAEVSIQAQRLYAYCRRHLDDFYAELEKTAADNQSKREASVAAQRTNMADQTVIQDRRNKNTEARSKITGKLNQKPGDVNNININDKINLQIQYAQERAKLLQEYAKLLKEEATLAQEFAILQLKEAEIMQEFTNILTSMQTAIRQREALKEKILSICTEIVQAIENDSVVRMLEEQLKNQQLDPLKRKIFQFCKEKIARVTRDFRPEPPNNSLNKFAGWGEELPQSQYDQHRRDGRNKLAEALAIAAAWAALDKDADDDGIIRPKLRQNRGR